jgi:hypothetical protein
MGMPEGAAIVAGALQGVGRRIRTRGTTMRLTQPFARRRKVYHGVAKSGRIGGAALSVACAVALIGSCLLVPAMPAHADDTSVVATLGRWTRQLNTDGWAIRAALQQAGCRSCLRAAEGFAADAARARRAMLAEQPSSAHGQRIRQLAIAGFADWAKAGDDLARAVRDVARHQPAAARQLVQQTMTLLQDGERLLNEARAAGGGTRQQPAAPPAGQQSIQALLPALPAADAQPLAAAVAKLPAAEAQRLIAGLQAIPPQQREALATALRSALDPLAPADRQALADVLLGVASPDEQQGVAAIAVRQLQHFAQTLYNLAPAAAGGDEQLLGFLQTLFQTLVPHIEQLLATAFQRLPVAVQPLVLAEDLTQLQQLDPRSIVLSMLMLQDSQSATLVQSAGYQAGYACGLGSCTPFDNAVIYISSVPVLPGPLQQDYVDCVLTPVCTPVERQALIEYILQLYVESKISYNQRQALIEAMERSNDNVICGWLAIRDPSFEVDCPRPHAP